MTVNEDLLDTYESNRQPVIRIYEPHDISVVLGAGRRTEGDIHEAAVDRDGIPILRRRGGGGTVVLSPGMVVLALVKEVTSAFRNREYTQEINSWFTESLESLGVKGIQARGISDLALGERKILGASLFRRRLIIFYQGSLMVNNQLSLLTRYLTYPSRVPEYRRSRSHEEFCTNLWAASYRIPVHLIINALTEVTERRLNHL